MEEKYADIEAGFMTFYRSIIETLFNKSYEAFCLDVSADEREAMMVTSRLAYGLLYMQNGGPPDVDHYTQLVKSYRMMQNAQWN